MLQHLSHHLIGYCIQMASRPLYIIINYFPKHSTANTSPRPNAAVMSATLAHNYNNIESVSAYNCIYIHVIMIIVMVANTCIWPVGIMLCKAKGQYMFTCKVSGYCLVASHCIVEVNLCGVDHWQRSRHQLVFRTIYWTKITFYRIIFNINTYLAYCCVRNSNIPIPSKHETMNKWRFNVGTASQTVGLMLAGSFEFVNLKLPISELFRWFMTDFRFHKMADNHF